MTRKELDDLKDDFWNSPEAISGDMMAMFRKLFDHAEATIPKEEKVFVSVSNLPSKTPNL